MKLPLSPLRQNILHIQCKTNTLCSRFFLCSLFLCPHIGSVCPLCLLDFLSGSISVSPFRPGNTFYIPYIPNERRIHPVYNPLSCLPHTRSDGHVRQKNCLLFWNNYAPSGIYSYITGNVPPVTLGFPVLGAPVTAFSPSGAINVPPFIFCRSIGIDPTNRRSYCHSHQDSRLRYRPECTSCHTAFESPRSPAT